MAALTKMCSAAPASETVLQTLTTRVCNVENGNPHLDGKDLRGRFRSQGKPACPSWHGAKAGCGPLSRF